MGFLFVIRDTECNSKIFGDCEICNKQVVQVFHQKRYEVKINPITNKKNNHFITDCYGHYDCLMKNRNQCKD
tara:strand:+ start:242 stop:457 length:216 start_codon:yes stop_codon:yes gene_type:complete